MQRITLFVGIIVLFILASLEMVTASTFTSKFQVGKVKLLPIGQLNRLNDMDSVRYSGTIDYSIDAVYSGRQEYYVFSLNLSKNEDSIISTTIITPQGIEYPLNITEDGNFYLGRFKYISIDEMAENVPPGEYNLIVTFSDNTTETLTTTIPDYNTLSFPDYVQGSIAADNGAELVMSWSTVSDAERYRIIAEHLLEDDWEYSSGNIYSSEIQNFSTTITDAYADQSDYWICIWANGEDLVEGRFTVESASVSTWVLFADNQCATFDSITNTLHIPYVDLGAPYWVDLTLAETDPITLTLTDFGAREYSGEPATFDGLTNTVHIPCLDLGTSYWIDLKLIENNPIITLELTDFGEN